MGDWCLVIRGVGQHHNVKGKTDAGDFIYDPNDAQEIVPAIIALLERSQNIRSVSLTYGAAQIFVPEKSHSE